MFVHLAGVGDFVLAEAQVTSSPSPCSGASGLPPLLQPCPAGAVYNPFTQQCQIVTAGLPTVVVGQPFRGPAGGNVVPLAVARKLYKSPCLNGPGPNYVIVATAASPRVNGTMGPDRIIGVSGNDRIAGLSGNDCLDGGHGRDRLYDDNGNDRVYGGSGNDRIAVGNGNDRIWGGAGNDWITAGNGRDMVLGGSGSDRIDVGLGKDRVTGGSGRNRIYAPAPGALVNCGRDRGNAAFVDRAAAAYAHRHGCELVHMIH